MFFAGAELHPATADQRSEVPTGPGDGGTQGGAGAVHTSQGGERY